MIIERSTIAIFVPTGLSTRTHLSKSQRGTEKKASKVRRMQEKKKESEISQHQPPTHISGQVAPVTVGGRGRGGVPRPPASRPMTRRRPIVHLSRTVQSISPPSIGWLQLNGNTRTERQAHVASRTLLPPRFRKAHALGH